MRALLLLPVLAVLTLGLSSVMPGASPVRATERDVTAATPLQASCGDYRCSPPEDCRSCPADCGNCCGDRRCQPPEDVHSCPADCDR